MIKNYWIPGIFFTLVVLVFTPIQQAIPIIQHLPMVTMLDSFDIIPINTVNIAKDQPFNPFINSQQTSTPTPFPDPSELLGCSGCDEIAKERIAMLLTATAEKNLALSALSTPTTPIQKVVIYFFWGDGCPHCAKAKPFFEHLANSDPRIDLRMYEVWNDPSNAEIFDKMATIYGMTARYVPTYFIGAQYWEGYGDIFNADIRGVVNQCLSQGCPDYGAAAFQASTPITMITPTKMLTPSPPAPATKPAALPTSAPRPQEQTPLPPTIPPIPPPQNTIDIPFFGAVDLSKNSLLFSTLIIAFVDGFNPCSIWVLSVLLAITLHSGSRKKVIIIGLVFITVTALIYALFIAGLFTVFTFIRFIGWIQVAVAGVALIFGLINLKDYFWYKQGISFTIDDQQKPGLYQRIRKLVLTSNSLLGMIVGTIILAGGVSLIEFSCTAGFPIIWSNLVSAQQVPWMSFVFLLIIYMIVYQLDELGLFFIAVFTLRAAKITEKHGRTLKLIGGILMLSLAVVMLSNPHLMNSIEGSLFVFGMAFFVSAGILIIHRIFYPYLKVNTKID